MSTIRFFYCAVTGGKILIRINAELCLGQRECSGATQCMLQTRITDNALSAGHQAKVKAKKFPSTLQTLWTAEAQTTPVTKCRAYEVAHTIRDREGGRVF